jgi:two-component system chemotaxis response regulator CheB
MNLTFEALRAGALTVVGKPGLADPQTCDKVVRAVRLMAEVPVVRRWGREKVTPPSPKPSAPPKSLRAHRPMPEAKTQQHPDIIGIASSTGGPATLATILGDLPADFPVPILIVQHVTNGFVTGLAEWLDNVTPLHVGLVSHGEAPRPETVLLAPDDYHLQVNNRGVMELYKGPPYKGLRPSANHLFHSLARTYGPSAAGIVLTGMGDDGAEGLLALRQAGGLTIAQDEQSCVVYGMPREAVARRAANHILSRYQIAPFLKQVVQDAF